MYRVWNFIRFFGQKRIIFSLLFHFSPLFLQNPVIFCVFLSFFPLFFPAFNLIISLSLILFFVFFVPFGVSKNLFFISRSAKFVPIAQVSRSPNRIFQNFFYPFTNQHLQILTHSNPTNFRIKCASPSNYREGIFLPPWKKVVLCLRYSCLLFFVLF